MSRLRYANPPPHRCDLPDTSHIRRWTEDQPTVLARWWCPVCRSTWAYVGDYMGGANRWVRQTGPSWRWKRQERRRLAALEGQS